MDYRYCILDVNQTYSAILGHKDDVKDVTYHIHIYKSIVFVFMFTFKETQARRYVCLSVSVIVLYLKLLYIRLMHVISLCPFPPSSLRWPE